MSVTASTAVNPAQILAWLGHPPAVLRIEGDQAVSGAVLSSDQLTDDQIGQALAAVTYDPHFGSDPEVQQALTTIAALTNNSDANVASLAQAAQTLLAGLGIQRTP